MAMNFPDSPTVGQVYTVGSRSWTWDGTTWNGKASTTAYTANKALISDGSGNATTSTTSATELGYVAGVTSSIQTQIAATNTALTTKANLIGPTFSNAGLTTVQTAGATYISNGGQVNTLQVFQPNAGTDAFMSFHVAGDYAAHFGIDGTTNDLAYGGWSAGAVKHRVFHQGNIRLASQAIGDIGSSWTTDSNWIGQVIRSVGGAVTVYVTNIMSVGQRMDFLQYGSGQITFQASGVTLNASGGKLKTSGQYSMASIICHAPGYYVLVGDIAA